MLCCMKFSLLFCLIGSRIVKQFRVYVCSINVTKAYLNLKRWAASFFITALMKVSSFSFVWHFSFKNRKIVLTKNKGNSDTACVESNLSFM